MIRLLTAAAVLAVGASTAAAQTPRPKLVVAIAVDQLSADLFAEYRPLFRGGFRRLLEGVVFPSGYQSHAATETCPGHATILTGADPGRAGIVANTWFDPARPRTGPDGQPSFEIYCAEDESVPGSSARNYTVSPIHLKVPTLGDRLKAANPATRVVAVAGKDRAAIMMGGHAIDEGWWWKGSGFATSADRSDSPPAGVAALNARAAALIAQPTRPVVPPVCAARAGAVAVGADGSVGIPSPRPAGNAAAFRASHELDELTLDLAARLTADMRLGRGSATDVLAIGLSTTDIVGHAFGTAGVEMCVQLMAVDAMLGRFLTTLDRSGIEYFVVLTADHGGHDLPERDAQRASQTAARVDAALLPKALEAELQRQFAYPGRMLHADGPFGDMYLDRAIPAVLRPRVLAALRARLLAHPQVEAAFTAEELARPPARRAQADEWTVQDRFRASFDPARSGDLVVALKQGVTPIAAGGTGYVATHGSPWDYDRRVPILFWWRGVRGFEQPGAVETVDILPTLAPLLGLALPAAEIDGRCRDLDKTAASSCN